MSQKKYNHVTGKTGEQLGIEYLKERGYQIVGHNVRAPFGEIDLVAREGNALVFIEIKARRSLAFGRPEEAVTLQKRKQLERLASWYLMKLGDDNFPVRFDVLSVLLAPGELPEFRLIQGAFD